MSLAIDHRECSMVSKYTHLAFFGYQPGIEKHIASHRIQLLKYLDYKIGPTADPRRASYFEVSHNRISGFRQTSTSLNLFPWSVRIEQVGRLRVRLYVCV